MNIISVVTDDYAYECYSISNDYYNCDINDFINGYTSEKEFVYDSFSRSIVEFMKECESKFITLSLIENNSISKELKTVVIRIDDIKRIYILTKGD